MQKNEHNLVKTLIILALFIAIIIVGFVTLSHPHLNYKLDMQQTVELALSQDGIVYPAHLKKMLNNAEKSVVIIDIRDAYQFGRGHLPGAENISAVELISEDNLERISELNASGNQVLIYGNTLSEANGPFMILRQIGYNNTFVLAGGYQHYQAMNMQNDGATDQKCIPNEAKFNYAEVAKSSASNDENNTETKKPVIFERKKKTSAVAGGC